MGEALPLAERGLATQFKPHVWDAKVAGKVEAYAEYMGEEHIGPLVGLSRNTIRKYYGAELEIGRARMVEEVARGVIGKARKGEGDYDKFVLRTLGGFRDNRSVELAGPGGGPIPVATVDLTSILQGKSDDELATIEGVLVQLATAFGGTADESGGG